MKISPPSSNTNSKIDQMLRIPHDGSKADQARNHVVAMLGEFLGTFLFLFIAFAATTVALAAKSASKTIQPDLQSQPDIDSLMFIAVAFGFSLAVNAWVFFRVTGGLFNPAVALGLYLIGAVEFIRTILVVIAQIVGAIAASAVVAALFPGPLNVDTKLNSETSVVRGLFIEMFLTAELVFTIFLLAAEKHRGTFIAPLGIGLALFVGQLAGVYYTGAAMNPVRAFGPDVVNGSFQTYHWIYWVGPILGALVATAFYRLVKLLEYESTNPGQDAAGDDGTNEMEKLRSGSSQSAEEQV